MFSHSPPRKAYWNGRWFHYHDLAVYLHVGPKRLLKVIAGLGIERGPRFAGETRRAPGKQRRPLTRDEALRVLEAVRAEQGLRALDEKI